MASVYAGFVIVMDEEHFPVPFRFWICHTGHPPHTPSSFWW
jgi:hypothetical protein